MLTYGYYCTVCKKGTISREIWLRHLLEDPHQSLTRVECVEWGEEIRERSLIAYCSVPVTAGAGETGEMLLHFLSTDKTVVADFVWSSENPTVAVVQLEKEKIVRKIMSRIGAGAMVSITQGFQVKILKGNELLDYQWPIMLSSMKAFHTAEVEGLPSSSNSRSTSLPATPSRSITSGNLSTRNPAPLSIQLDSICKSVQLSEDLINAAQNVVSVLETILKGWSVNILRGWNLKFKHEYCNYLLLYVTKRIPNEEATIDFTRPWKSQKMSSTVVRDQILSSDLRSKMSKVPITKSKRDELGLGTRFQFHSGFTFNYVTLDTFIIEGQLSRLIRYMCTFDQRCIPLLSLVHRWARTHKIMFHETNDLFTNHCTFHCLCEPAALEWMVMLFMCRKGLIPTPRQIQSHTHRPVFLPKIDVDVGFSNDPTFVESWKATHETLSEESKEEFALSVVKLAQEFFSLFGTALASGSWILNTRDGQLLSTFELLPMIGEPIPEENAHYSEIDKHCLEEEEINILKNLPVAGGRGMKDPVNFDDLNRFRIYVVNPLYFRWRLSLCNTRLPRICKTMYQTGESLLEFLKIWEKAEVDKVDLLLSDYL